MLILGLSQIWAPFVSRAQITLGLGCKKRIVVLTTFHLELGGSGFRSFV